MLAENTCDSIEAMIAAVLACGMTLHIVSGLPQFGAPLNIFTTSSRTPSRLPISLVDLDVLDRRIRPGERGVFS